MHRFGRKEDLLKTFEQITLQFESKNRSGRGNIIIKLDNKQQFRTKEAEQRGEIKCYNCNKLGYLARNCDKPKRERGTSFDLRIIRNHPKLQSGEANDVAVGIEPKENRGPNMSNVTV